MSSHWWISLIINDNIIEDKLSKILFQKCVYQTGSSSHEPVPRSSSQFQKGWWPLNHSQVAQFRMLYNWVCSLCNPIKQVKSENLIRSPERCQHRKSNDCPAVAIWQCFSKIVVTTFWSGFYGEQAKLLMFTVLKNKTQPIYVLTSL